MNYEQATVLTILLNQGPGIIAKDPDYIREKIEAVQRGDHPERLLDGKGLRLYQAWLTRWVYPKEDRLCPG